ARLRSLLSLDDSPGKIALSFAVGLFITISPFYGFHTLLGILSFTLFRLNKVSVMTGAILNMPWISPGIYFPCYYVGAKIWKLVPALDRYELFTWLQFKTFFSSWFTFQTLFEPANFMKLFIPTLIGSTLIGFVISVCSYYILKHWISKRRMGKRSRIKAEEIPIQQHSSAC
ncbi:DUF2062 domain-containing protein, partial [candidate division CSSED10-310 bacterium]